MYVLLWVRDKISNPNSKPLAPIEGCALRLQPYQMSITIEKEGVTLPPTHLVTTKFNAPAVSRQEAIAELINYIPATPVVLTLSSKY